MICCRCSEVGCGGSQENQPIASATRAAINPSTQNQDTAPISNSILVFIHSNPRTAFVGAAVSHITCGGRLCQFLVTETLSQSINPVQAVIPELRVGLEKEKMIRMFRIIVRLLKNEKGLTAIEYALIAALMLIAVEEMSTRL